MITNRLVLLLVGLSVLGAGALAAACGDGGEPTLESYFDDLEQISRDYSEDERDLGAEADQQIAEAGDLEEQIEIAQVWAEDQVILLATFVEDLEALDPPPAAAGAHEDAIETTYETIEAIDGLPGQLEHAADRRDFDRAFEAAGSDVGRVTNACRQLQRIASARGIDVDLGCETTPA